MKKVARRVVTLWPESVREPYHVEEATNVADQLYGVANKLIEKSFAEAPASVLVNVWNHAIDVQKNYGRFLCDGAESYLHQLDNLPAWLLDFVGGDPSSVGGVFWWYESTDPCVKGYTTGALIKSGDGASPFDLSLLVAWVFDCFLNREVLCTLPAALRGDLYDLQQYILEGGLFNEKN